MAVIDSRQIPATTGIRARLTALISDPTYHVQRAQVLTILLTLAAGGILGLLMTLDSSASRKILVAQLALPGLGVLLFGIFRPDLAPVAILFSAAFVPLSLSTGTASRLVASLVLTSVLVAGWVLRMVVGEKRIKLAAVPVNRPLLGFMAVTIVSLAWSIGMRDPLVVTGRNFLVVQIGSAVVMLMLPAAFLLLAARISSLRLLQLMVGVMLVAGVAGAVKQYGALRLPVNTDGLFSMWVMSLSAGLALFHRRLPIVFRGLLLLLAFVWVYWGFGLHISWVTGWFMGFVALGIITLSRSRKFAAFLGIVMIALVLARSDYYLGKVLRAEQQESGYTRVNAWQTNWRVTGKHVLFGTGPAGYAAYYMSYFPTEAMATHSNFLDILSQTGITGFVFCNWFFLSLMWYGNKVRRRLAQRGDFAEALVNAALAGTVGSFVAMGFGDWIFPFAYTQTIAGFDHAVYSWLFMGTIVAVDRLTMNEPHDAASEINELSHG